jgi:hypothetical protein
MPIISYILHSPPLEVGLTLYIVLEELLPSSSMRSGTSSRMMVAWWTSPKSTTGLAAALFVAYGSYSYFGCLFSAENNHQTQLLECASMRSLPVGKNTCQKGPSGVRAWPSALTCLRFPQFPSDRKCGNEPTGPSHGRRPCRARRLFFRIRRASRDDSR